MELPKFSPWPDAVAEAEAGNPNALIRLLLSGPPDSKEDRRLVRRFLHAKLPKARRRDLLSPSDQRRIRDLFKALTTDDPEIGWKAMKVDPALEFIAKKVRGQLEDGSEFVRGKETARDVVYQRNSYSVVSKRRSSQ